MSFRVIFSTLIFLITLRCRWRAALITVRLTPREEPTKTEAPRGDAEMRIVLRRTRVGKREEGRSSCTAALRHVQCFATWTSLLHFQLSSGYLKSASRQTRSFDTKKRVSDVHFMNWIDSMDHLSSSFTVFSLFLEERTRLTHGTLHLTT